jgi:hypothetical protein
MLGRSTTTPKPKVDGRIHLASTALLSSFRTFFLEPSQSGYDVAEGLFITHAIKYDGRTGSLLRQGMHNVKVGVGFANMDDGTATSPHL